ncbi:hypothetical protein NST33_18125 [Paenibacillus sp. FSL L8-0435]|uniref:hypothetical protein n=1 Tax=Paenibacillus sp. FSL L8-0435 TaxID=2954618 RepID=UPI0030D7D6C3
MTQLFKNELFAVEVRENGMHLEFDIEGVSRGCGFTTVAKSGNATIRWNRVNEYLSSFGYSVEVQKGDYIPESYVYLLMMKANSVAAIEFQKFIAFEVLPKIRRNKIYIDPSATDQEIDIAVKFATPQKRRKALIEATIDGKENIYTIYEDIKEFISKWTAAEKITTLEHVEKVLLDKQEAYGKDVAFAHTIEELLRAVAKDLDKLKNWKNGAVKRELKKEIIMLSSNKSE